MFLDREIMPGIIHITDEMGVSFTLIEGEERAILFDAGYGTENVEEHIRSLTAKPVTLLLSHGHHDHVLGAAWFTECRLCRDDLDEFRLRTGEAQRAQVIRQAAENGITVSPDFGTRGIPTPREIRFTGHTGPFDDMAEDLGARMVRVIRVPGHTAGSIVLFLPKERLLLTGDDWNPCTWMWFPCSLPAARWRANMQTLVRELERDGAGEIRLVLCSHQQAPRKASEMKAFLEYMTEERMRTAPAEPMNSPINTHVIRKDPEGWALIFDRDRYTDL